MNKPSKEWNARIREQINHYKKVARKNKIGDAFTESMDYSRELTERRTNAILNTIETAYARYPSMSDLGPKKEILGNEWIFLNLPLHTYSRIESRSHILFAAAIWILDNITADGEWEKRKALFKLIPKDEEFLDEIFSPDVWDCQHEWDLIAGVQHILHFRNDDILPIQMDVEKHERVITDVPSATETQHTDVPSRQDFDQLLSLIPEEAIKAAVSHFEALFWDWSDRYFASIAPLCREIDSYEREMAELFMEYDEKRLYFEREMKQALQRRKQNRKNLRKGITNQNPLLVKPNLLASPTPQSPVLKNLDRRMPAEFLTDPELHHLMTLSGELNEMQNRLDALEEKAESISLKKGRLSISLVGGEMLLKADNTFDEISEYWEGFSIPDPYELCFALLYLIDHGSNLPWLYGVGCGLMEAVSESLPWGIIEYDESDDEIWQGEAEDADKPSDIPDWYDRRFFKKKDDFGIRRSMAQILYEETGCLLPRNLHLYDSRAKELRRYGIRGTNATTLLTCMTALSHARRMTPYPDFDIGTDASMSEPSSDVDTEEKLHALQEEVKRLRSALYSAEKGTREVKRDLEDARKKSAIEHRELADLREYVFNQDALEEEAPDADSTLFPYYVTKNTVVFGGHKTWNKAIRPLFEGNIRFVDKDLVFDVNIIRNADMVWIQPNALAHKQYYRIIDVARQNRKPVRYFTSASAVKCAHQLVDSLTS